MLVGLFSNLWICYIKDTIISYIMLLIIHRYQAVIGLWFMFSEGGFVGQDETMNPAKCYD